MNRHEHNVSNLSVSVGRRHSRKRARQLNNAGFEHQERVDFWLGLAVSVVAVVVVVVCLWVWGAASADASSTLTSESTAKAIAAGAGGAPYVSGQIVVGFAAGTTSQDRRNARRAAGVSQLHWAGGRSSVAIIRDGSIHTALARLRSDPRVRYAAPNYVARMAGANPTTSTAVSGNAAASAYIPNDPGSTDGEAGGWQRRQWNFVGPFGINLLPAWESQIGKPGEGGAGVIVAVIDTGVAYENKGRYRRSPDLSSVRIFRAHDFVHGDRHANDDNGHGTHVASTIVQQTNNGVGLTGIAYRARLMPIKALDSAGSGDAGTIARSIRYAARNGADVINLSMEFDASLLARDIPDVISAIRYAHYRGAVVVAAAGNQAATSVAYPARVKYAIGVSATTISGCLAEYSNVGRSVDIAAPGGGADAQSIDSTEGSTDLVNCAPGNAGPPIYQVTFSGISVRRFGLPNLYEGTSMAAPHISGIAALVIASGVLGPNPSPRAVGIQLEQTARDLGRPGRDRRYGAGLVDAAAALGVVPAPTAPTVPTGPTGPTPPAPPV